MQISKLKAGNHISISTDTKKKFGKVKHGFVIKALETLWINKVHLKIAKVLYNKPMVNVILKGEKLKASQSEDEDFYSSLAS